jgi:hypothetical protein
VAFPLGVKMNHSANSSRYTARRERQQRKLDAGFLSAQFPEVAGIVISMAYHQRDAQESFPRIINFFPGSYAFFRIDCLNKNCGEGGFDFTQVITGMIRNRRENVKGDINCEGGGHSAGHAAIAYEVAIKYA